jgi:hypothetical protein
MKSKAGKRKLLNCYRLQRTDEDDQRLQTKPKRSSSLQTTIECVAVSVKSQKKLLLVD